MELLLQNNRVHKTLLFLLIATALYCVGVVFYSMFFIYEPIPFWDEWDAYLHFYEKFKAGGKELWDNFFVQHNEHKIFFAKVLIWIGFLFSDNALSFSMNMIFILQFITLSSFSYIVHKTEPNKIIRWALTCFAFILGYTWSQNENFMWGFQTQFIGVYMNATLSFLFLYLFTQKKNIAFFLLSLSFIFLCVFTLANGFIAGLVLIALAWYLKKVPLLFKVIITLVTLFVIYKYLYNFHPVEGHTSITNSLFHHSLDVVAYTLIYIGAVFHYWINANEYFSMFFGSLWVIAFAFALYYHIFRKKLGHISVVLLCLASFIFLSAITTGLGRVGFGLRQAMSSRYETPAILAWISVLLYYFLTFKQKYFRFFLACIMLFIVSIVLKNQVNVIADYKLKMYARRRELLAFKMGVRSEYFTVELYPAYRTKEEFPLQIQDSIISFNPLIQEVVSEDSLRYSIEGIGTLQNDHQYFYVRGWAFFMNGRYSPNMLTFRNAETNQVVGYATCGRPRNDVKEVFNTNKYAGFEGFVSDTSHLVVSVEKFP